MRKISPNSIISAEPVVSTIVRPPKARLPFLLLFAMITIVALILIGLLAPYFTPYDPSAVDLRARLAPPLVFGGHAQHLLGTDELGRDVLSRLMGSIGMSLTIAVLSTLIAIVLGTSIGFVAAYFRGRTEQAILMLIDIQAAMPFMIIALAVLAFFGNSLMLFILLLGFYGWERVARLARGLAIAANEQGYTKAVGDLGASPQRIYLLHVLPNIGSTLIVAMTLNLPEVILLESSLSFLGLGVQPPLSSLGNMVGYAREYIDSAPWLLLVPSATIVLLALSVSIVGDWLRDKLDPTLE